MKVLSSQNNTSIVYYIILQMQRSKQQHKNFYDSKGMNTNSKGERQGNRMFELKAFNNWIKAVLINKYCKIKSVYLKKAYDLPTSNNLINVLDIGCGHGQDISKWKNANIGYLVGVDLSKKSIQQYQHRWRAARQPYKLLLISQSGCSQSLYEKIEHTQYDIASSQLCIHYMFNTRENTRLLLSNMLENLLIDGLLLLTIPDSCSIVKKIRELGRRDGDYFVYGNEYFSMRFKDIQFQATGNNDTDYFGLEYGFYLEDAIGSKGQNGEITYVHEWLIELTNFQKMLEANGMKVIQNLNFIEFYKKHKDEYEYSDLFAKFKLIFREGQSIKKQFWEIIHLYRILVAEKVDCGKSISEFSKKNRQASRKCLRQYKK